MAKKKRGRKMPAWKKWVRAGLGIAGSAIGGLVAFSPTFRGLQTMAKGDFIHGAGQVSFDTTGIDATNPSTQLDISKVIRTGVVAGVGIGLIMLFRAIARRV